MEQMLRAFILVIIVTLTFAGCKDLAAQIDPDFVGVWNGTAGASDCVISIDNGSNGYWHQDNQGIFSTAQGVARIKHDKLYIGLKSFSINRYPAKDPVNGKWAMMVCNVTYTRSQ